MVKLDQIQETIKPELAKLNAIIADTLKSPSALTNHIVTDYLRTKGKQIRPVLVLLSAKLFNGINERVLNAGAAIELLHNASLIHDDVIDQSMSRRGLPTVNSVWDNHVAVLVGDYILSTARWRALCVLATFVCSTRSLRWVRIWRWEKSIKSTTPVAVKSPRRCT